VEGFYISHAHQKGRFTMKNLFRLLGIITMAVIIGFSMAGCDQPTGGDTTDDNKPPVTNPGGDDPNPPVITPPGDPVAVSGVTLNKATLGLIAGGTETLIATVEPATATNRGLTWTSSDAAIATVANGAVLAKATGSATITATANGDNTKKAECTVTVYPVPDSIELTNAPRTWCVIGDTSLDLTGMVVTATHSGGTYTVPHDMITITGFNATLAGTNNITLTYGGKTANFILTVASIERIEVTAEPMKFAQGEPLDISVLDGITVTAFYSNSESENITDRIILANITGFSSTTAGTKELTVTYRTASAKFNVEVLGVKGISASIRDSKTIKTVKGEDLKLSDLADLIVTITFTDDSTEEVTIALSNISGYDPNTAGEQTLTINYSGQSTTFKVTVVELSSIAVTTPPSKIRYAIGEPLVTTGLVVTASYSDSTTENVTSKLDNIIGFNSSAATASQTVTVNYGGKTSSFTIKVYATVTFNANGGAWGGETTKTVETEGDVVVTPPTEPTRDTYAFDGWYTQQSGGTKVNLATLITTNQTFYAQWKASYVVTFNANGGNWSGATTQTVNVIQGNVVASPEEPTPASPKFYVFDTWYTEGETAYNFATPITEPITLYAHWTFNNVPLTTIADITEYLGTVPANTEDNPAPLLVNFALGTMTQAGSGWRQLLDAIDTAGKFVDLDLSQCTMTGTEFNPDQTVATGKNKIVTIALPTVAASIPLGGCYNFTILKSFSQTGTNLTTIGNNAFSNCTNLAMTALPAGVISIGDNAFMGCTNLALTALPAGVTSISNAILFGCMGITQFTLHEGITAIGGGVFRDCMNLALVTCLRATPPTLGTYAFLYHDGTEWLTLPNLRIEVPAASLNAYKTADGWRDYADRIFAITE
jgi:uncharacterized repeat protein (TIGR02543 family)